METKNKGNGLLNFIKKIFIGQISKVIGLVILVLLLLGVYVYFFSNPKAKVGTTYMINKLESASELTTAELSYTGYTEYTDEGTKFFNREDFKMVYKAKARIGIDVKEIEVERPNPILKTITVKIPKAKILDVKVDSSDIQFFDEGLSILNFNDREDATQAISLAEKEAEKELSNMGVLDMANIQSEALITGLLENVTPEDYKLVIKIVK